MRTRSLGRSGLEISEIVFGAGSVGGGVFTGPEAGRSALVKRALELGINWIDTAPGYGDGQSEENLGRILPELGVDPFLSTKVRIGPGDEGDIRGAVERCFAASLARLKRSSVTLLQLHNRVEARSDLARGAVGVDDVLGAGGIAAALDRIRANGGTRLIGFTGLGDADALHALVASGRFDTLQAYYNLLNPTAAGFRPADGAAGFSAYDYRGLIPAAAAAGMGVLVIRVLAAGAIAGAAPRAGRLPLSPGSAAGDDIARAAVVERALHDEPGTMPQRAIRFALDTPGVSGVLVGFANVAQVNEAIGAAELAPMAARARKALEDVWAADFR